MSWGKKEQVYGAANRVTAVNKLYGLCHLLPSTPRGRLRKEEAIKTHLLQTSKTDNYPPTSWGSEMCTGRRRSASGPELVEGTPMGGALGRGRRAGGGGGQPGTYHNDVFMLLGSQVCVLKDQRMEQEENNAKNSINQMEHLCRKGPTQLQTACGLSEGSCHFFFIKEIRGPSKAAPGRRERTASGRGEWSSKALCHHS